MDGFTKDGRRHLLTVSLSEKKKIAKKIITDILKVAKRPVIQFSGGADSCLLAYLIHEVDPTVPCVFNDWGLFLPRTKEFVFEYFKKYNCKYFVSESGYDYKSFLQYGNLPLFKGVKSFMPPSKYKEYGISDKCRTLKKICWKKFRKEYNPDYYFLGILASETGQRKGMFIKEGFIQKKGVEHFAVKPIILFTKPEVFSILKEKNILWPQDAYEYEYGGEKVNWHEKCDIKCLHSDLECFMCPVRFAEKGWGRLGRVARKYPKLFKEVMNLGIRESFQKIVKDYPLQSDYIQTFLKEYDNA